MLSFTTLGAVGLDGHAGASAPHPLLAQPRRLALLAYLAVGRPGSLVFRDTLLALLWPDHDSARGRRSLRQTLYHLRRETGSGIIVGGGQASVGVDAAALWCDAVAFERAIVEGRLEAAVELYGGEFMPGFHAGAGSDFERWLDETRDRLRRKAMAAAIALAQQAEAEGDGDSAIARARWLVNTLPCDERAGRSLIRLLARSGDRAGAMAAYRDLAARLARELEIEPAAETRALVHAVRTGAATAPLPATAPGRASAPAGVPAHAGATVPATAAPPRPVEVRLQAQDVVPHALAVLPFVSLSGTASGEQFAEGLTEMVITELARRPSLVVVSRTSSQRYRGGGHSLAVAAQELGVGRVVEGTVLDAGSRVRVTAQLLATPPERHIWADSFDRRGDDSLGTQAELARTIAGAIDDALARHEGGRGAPASSAAHDAYFNGRCQFVRMTPSSVAEALRHFQDAVRLDPSFAPAHAGIAYAHGVLARMGLIAPTEGYARMRRCAERALALEPRNAEAHIALGMCTTVLDRDWALAERHITLGIEHASVLSESWWSYSYFLCVTARRDEALRAARRARALDPVAPTIWLNEVLVLAAAGDVRAALVSAREFAAFHRDSSASAFALGVAGEAAGDHATAAAAFERAVVLGGGPHSIAARGHNLACMGRTADARALLDGLLAIEDRYVPPTSLARIHAAVGDRDEAFRCLDRAADMHDDWLLLMDGWPRFEPIRDDPRFAALRQRLGLPEPR
jgi:TolB-like protein/DNA-binding SARP family transcriptional activator